MRWLVRRVQKSLDDAKRLVHDPKSSGSLLRGAVLRLWRARGGGFYGLGYLISFGVLQLKSFAGDVSTSNGAGDFVVGQVAGYVLRVTVESFANGVQALVWPLLVLGRFELPGIAMLGIGYLVFERRLRPLIETWFPELRKPHESDAPGASSTPPLE